MNRMNHWLALAALATLCVGNLNLMAQDGPPPGGDRGGRGSGRGGWDPAQMQQRMLEFTRERLEIKDDAEWKAIEPLISKVGDLRREQIGGMGRGFMGRNRGGDQGGRSRWGGEATAEETGLSDAIEKSASKDELKAKMDAFRKAKAAKEAELKTAQENLKKVLTTKQEAIALELGLVN